MNLYMVLKSTIGLRRICLLKNIVSKNIGDIMTHRNITQQELASISQLSRNTINKHATALNDSNPTLLTLIKISKALDVDMPQLFSEQVDLNTQYDQNMNLEKYINLFKQNLEYQLRGRNQNFLSYEFGVGESTISEILNNNIINPKLTTIYRISIKLEMKLENMFKRGAGI